VIEIGSLEHLDVSVHYGYHFDLIIWSYGNLSIIGHLEFDDTRGSMDLGRVGPI
jgi:hypothetical protein